MADLVLQELGAFIDRMDEPERSLVIRNSSEPTALGRLLESAFETQPIEVGIEEAEDVIEDEVVLLEAGTVVATSSLSTLMDSYLLVNSDLYRTGTSGVDQYEAPDVLTGLEGMQFRLRGFPESNKEKLLLIVLSRHIERLALDAESGRLRSSFQRLSRLEDERGTKEVYRRLAAVGVDTHVYGVPDADLSELGVTVHGGTTPVYRQSWFVVFEPDDDDGQAAALVALEIGDNEWRGTWTFDPTTVEEIGACLDRL